MKKIISIILGILLMFSMSITSFATLVAEPTTSTSTSEVAKPENVIVSVDFGNETFTEANTGSTFLSTGKLRVKITNNLSKAIMLSDISIDITGKCPKFDGDTIVKEDEKTVYDTFAVSIDNVSKESDYIINKGDQNLEVVYDLNIVYNASLLNKVPAETIFTIIINNVSKDIDVKDPWTTWTFVEEVKADTDEDTSDSTDTSTPSEPESTEPEVTDKEETSTSTTQPSTSTPEVTNPVTPETEEPSKAPADVDDTIPDTGATVPFAAIGTLVTSAITALVAKKKKEN